MNAGRMLIHLARRSYVTRRRTRNILNPGIDKRLEMLEDKAEHDLESVEHLDLESFESDFMNINTSYKTHKKELHDSKEKLKLRIVTRKYFKENDPNLLTFMEKEQIRYLHASDPTEWTPDKLSESFPVLPHTIQKVIKAKWLPKSADRVLKHDQSVINNWEKFKRGELPINPQLRQHLDKFKNRIITLPKREELEGKVIPPPPTFSTPKHALFSRILQTHEVNMKSVQKLESGSSNTKQISDEKSPKQSIKSIGKPATLSPSEDTYVIGKQYQEHRHVTLNKFVERKMRNPNGIRSEQDKLMIDAHVKNREASENMQYMPEKQSLRISDKQTSARDIEKYKDSTETVSKTDESMITSSQLLDPTNEMKDSKQLELRTYVKSWEKTGVEEVTYEERILIPKDKYKQGKSYRVGQCYYDSDGEFLYKVLVNDD